MLRIPLAMILLLAAGLLRAAEPRGPVALVATEDRLLVACRNGTLVSVDLQSGKLGEPAAVAESLSDLQSCNGRLLAVDSQRRELLLIAHRGGTFAVAGRLTLPTEPVRVVVDAAGKHGVVSCRWAQQLVTFDVAPTGLKRRATIDLPFAPRELCLKPDGRRLIAADAFGGRLAAVALQPEKLVAVRSLEGHNLRGLVSPDGENLLVAQQLLIEYTPTERNRVFWGSVVSNILRTVAVDPLFEPQPNPATSQPRPVPHWQLAPLGGSGRAAGDPGAVVTNDDGLVAVALSGVNEVGIRPPGHREFTRVPVGDRPVALAISHDHRELYVANQFDDSLALIDLATLRVRTTLRLAPPQELTSEERGERLFYDARLSLDGWYSCASCHSDGHANGLLNDNQGDSTFGTPKRILSLLGTGRTGPWAWNGSRGTLEEQIRKSIEQTMHGTDEKHPVPVQNVVDIAAYLRTLEPPPGIDTARGRVNTQAAARGRKLFDDRGCLDCHARPGYTSPKVFDVGLADELGQRYFNPPSLFGVSQRSRFFHDNRAASLRDVFRKYGHAETADLTDEELNDLLALLRSL